MNLAGRLRATPALLRIGFAEAVAYRAEFLVWILSTTMPLIMLALWSAVARDAPVGRYGQAGFTAYFLATFVVRQLTMSWVAWELNFEIRQGTIAPRLLRPFPPVVAYAAENVAALPLRLLVALPVAAAGLALAGGSHVTHDAWTWAALPLALAGGWLIGFLTSFAVGCLAFHIDSSVKVMDLWFVLFFVFGGYTIPIDLFPPALRTVADLLPFRYQQALPVEMMTGALDRATMWIMLGRQWLWVAGIGGLAALAWRSGVRRFAAFGG